MTDNIVTSSSVNPSEDKPKKQTAAKKTTAKKAAPKKTTDTVVSNEKVLIVFESGSSYSSGEIRFTRDNKMQEVPREQADFLLTLDNFRLADQLEIEEYLNSKEG